MKSNEVTKASSLKVSTKGNRYNYFSALGPEYVFQRKESRHEDCGL